MEQQAAYRRRTPCNQTAATDTQQQQTPRSGARSQHRRWSQDGDACVHTAEAMVCMWSRLARLSPGFRSSWSRVRLDLGVELRECVKGRSGSCAYAAAAVHAGGQAGSKTEIRGGGSMESAW